MKRCGKKGSVFLVVLPLVIILGLVLLFNFNSFNTGHATFDGGDGSSGNPWQISTCEQLQGMNESLTSHYILVSNIDCSNTSVPGESIWDNLGFVPVSIFTGSFDGQGYSIDNLYINSTADNYDGLFGRINGATLTNFTITNSEIRGRWHVGAVIGDAQAGSMESVGVENITVYSDGDNAGGFIGKTSAGFNIISTLPSSNISVSASSGDDNLGGFIGYSSCNVANVNLTGVNISSTNQRTGGIVGYFGNTYSLYNSYVSGTIDIGGLSFAGGAIGYQYSGTNISNVVTNVTVSGAYDLGGIIGYTYFGGTIVDSISYGDVNGNFNSNHGGILGRNQNGPVNITNCTSYGDVSGVSESDGGIVGDFHSGIINNSHSYGDISSTGSPVGGLVGFLKGGSSSIITNSSASGDVSGNQYIGGLIGYTFGYSGSLIENSYALGSVNAVQYGAGGIAGYFTGTLNNSYYYGNVSNDGTFPSHDAGFLVGRLVGGSAIVDNSYGAGYVFFNGVESNILVSEYSSSSSQNSYYLNGSNPLTDSHASGKNSSQMRTQSTFSNWDFANIWKVEESISYPCFIWQDLCPEQPDNTAPNLIQVFISPNSSVSESDTLQGYCNATDSDADNVTYYYNWYLNGVLNTSGLTSSQTQAELINVNNVSSSLTSKDQNWTLECIVNDGTENSTAVNSTTVTIGNTAPVVSNVAISPNPLSHLEDANCTFDFNDVDGDVSSSTIKWYVNNFEVQSGTSSILSNTFLFKGEPVYCSVIGNDGSVSIAAVNSNESIVQKTTAPSDVASGGGSGDTPTTEAPATTSGDGEDDQGEDENVPTTVSKKKGKEEVKEVILSRLGLSNSQGGVKKVSNVLKDIKEEPVAATIVLSLMLILLLLLLLLYFVIRKYVKFRNELKGKKNREDKIVKKRKQVQKEGALSRMTSKLALKLVK